MLGLYTMTNAAIVQEMSRTFSLFGCDYKEMINFIDINNTGFVSLGKDRAMLPNFEPGPITDDYRLKNIDLIQEDKRSAFFKLLIKSNELEKQKIENITKIPVAV